MAQRHEKPYAAIEYGILCCFFFQHCHWRRRRHRVAAFETPNFNYFQWLLIKCFVFFTRHSPHAHHTHLLILHLMREQNTDNKKMVINKCQNCAWWKGLAAAFKVTWKQRLSIQILYRVRWSYSQKNNRVGGNGTSNVFRISMGKRTPFQFHHRLQPMPLISSKCPVSYHLIVSFDDDDKNIEAELNQKSEIRVIKIDFPVELNGVSQIRP